MRDSNNQPWEGADAELDQLMRTYRDACGAPEPGANFMPQLWQRIEARQPWTMQVWRWARGMAAAAAAASLFLVMLQMLPNGKGDFYGNTYLETLADQHDDNDVIENVAFVNVKNGPERPPR